MSSDGDGSPVSAIGHHTTIGLSMQEYSIAGMPVDSPPLATDSAAAGVVKRPFLRRGSRMPVSKIPVDADTPVVQAIKNPPKPVRSVMESSDSHDFNRSSFIAEGKSSISARSSSTGSNRPSGRSASSALTRRPPRQSSPWNDDITAKHAEDLEAFLRDIQGSDTPPDTSEAQLDTTSNFNSHHPPSAMDRSYVSDHSFASTVTRRKKPPVQSRPVTEDHGSQRPSSMRSVRSAPQSSTSALEAELKSKLAELDAQVEKFKKENEYCKKLRLEREAALSEAHRLKERAVAELQAAGKDIEEQRALMISERKRLQQDKDRGKSLVGQLREMSDENKELKDRLVESETTAAVTQKKLKAEILRLTSLVNEVQKSKAELEVELKALMAGHQGHDRRYLGASASSAAPVLADTVASTALSEHASSMPGVSATQAVSSYTHPDGRIDRTFKDGRREAVFPSGLKKSVWTDGSALVLFPNGDVKETSAAGVVVYKYRATGCVQTNYPDGLEILKFASGQIEKHFPDGSKEISFPNQLVKRIDKDGRELD